MCNETDRTPPSLRGTLFSFEGCEAWILELEVGSERLFLLD